VFRVILSTLAAAFGVQSRKNLEADAGKQSPLPFIIAGILFTVIFIFSLLTIVKLVLS